MAEAIFRSNIPSDLWLQEKLQATQEDGRNDWGVPRTFGPITGSFDRPLILPVALLAGVPGERAEQSNVRQDSLAHIRANFEQEIETPVYVEVDPYGKAWMSEGNHRVMVAAERGVASLPTLVRYFSGGECEATDFEPSRLLARDKECTEASKPVPEVVRLARYIEPGDSFGERLSNGGGVLSAGVVVSVDREFGVIGVKYLSRTLEGVERNEKPTHECFSEIIAGRMRREQDNPLQEPKLFAIGDELRLADRVPVYEPVRFASNEEMQNVVLRRGGMDDFTGPVSKAVRTDTGLSFFEASSAPGNKSTYTYMLMREVGVMDRNQRCLVPSEAGQLVGMTKWDRMEIDQQPGLYYVNARKDGTQENALLLGPFEKHIDALLRTQQVSEHVSERYSEGGWYSYGTARLDVAAETAPRGKLNDMLLTEEERRVLPGVEKPVQQPDDWRIRRLAYVQEWSDAVIDCALRHLKDSPDALGVMQKAADDINLCALRGHDEALLESGAKALGFSSADEFTHFKRENPFLSACLKAEPALEGSSGFVVGVSSTEVVFAADNGAVMAFERAWLSTDIAVGDVVKVDRFRVAERTALALETPYKAGQTYNGIIPEIKYLPVTAIERQERDFRPEVMEVSDEVAANMDYSEPVDVTAFREGSATYRNTPEVVLTDGYHRTAAAIQTGKPWLPVTVKSVNARGEKLNALIAMSHAIELWLQVEASATMEY